MAQCLPIGKTLDDVLAFEETRVVGKDWCVQWNNRVFQIDAKHRPLHLPRRDVIVREKLDGSIVLVRSKIVLESREITRERADQKEQESQQTLAQRMARHAPQQKPKANHPWRTDGVGKAARKTG